VWERVVEGVGEQRTKAIPIPTWMPLESKRRHIHDPVLLSLKMEGIRLLFFYCSMLESLMMIIRGSFDFTEETAKQFDICLGLKAKFVL
jgi:hypothetical protein